MTVLALSHYEEVIDKEKKKERKDTSYLKERTTKRNGEKKITLRSNVFWITRKL